jgi:Ribulose-5-phosphate 4-epimerase and related epimerases and aldolases
MTELEIRQAIKDAGAGLVKENLVQGTWGNISVRLDEKTMLATPTASDYLKMTPESIVPVDYFTLEHTGDIKPTSEKKIHAAIYRERPEINAVIHSHPVWCSSVAAARRDLPIMSTEMEKTVGGCARIAEYGLPGTKKLTKATLIAIRGRNACLMANHGMVACAASLEEAFEVCRIMERSAREFIEKETLLLTKKDVFEITDIFRLFRERKKYSL